MQRLCINLTRALDIRWDNIEYVFFFWSVTNSVRLKSIISWSQQYFEVYHFMARMEYLSGREANKVVGRQIKLYENLVLPRSSVPCRSEVHNIRCYTTTVRQPCCCTMNLYENLALRYIQDLVIRSPYSNYVAVQWDVHENHVIPRSALSQRSA